MSVNVSIVPVASLKDNYIWTIINQPHRCALVVDPGAAFPVIEHLQRYQLNLTAILITHHHWDHTNGIAELNALYKVPVVGPIGENIPSMTLSVQDNEVITLSPDFPSYQIMAIPGHTLGHIAYYTHGSLFCGDTLFAAGCGRLFEGTTLQLYTSLQKISRLPEDTKIYCAHEYTLANLHFAHLVEPSNQDIIHRIEHTRQLLEKNQPTLPSTLKEEKMTNPFLRCHSPEIIANTEFHIEKKLSTSLEVFSALRQWKDHFKMAAV